MNFGNHEYHPNTPLPTTSFLNGSSLFDDNHKNSKPSFTNIVKPPYMEYSSNLNYPLVDDQQKIYSFVPLDVQSQKKRPRKKYNEVERLYQCTFQNCTKAYGTLNHLNAHVSMQGHVRGKKKCYFIYILIENIGS